jgi:hypothetical protein
MAELKLTLNQLKNYLGTGLEVLRPDNRTKLKLIGIEGDQTLIFDETRPITFGDINKSRPLCYRLSDLDKFIPELGFVPIEWFEETYYTLSLHKDVERLIEWEGHNWLNQMSFLLVTHLFEWHFWPFGDEYFESGLIIDKMTLGKGVSNV